MLSSTPKDIYLCKLPKEGMGRTAEGARDMFTVSHTALLPPHPNSFLPV